MARPSELSWQLTGVRPVRSGSVSCASGWMARPHPAVHLGARFAVAGERLVVLHMTWGAVNEWTTQGGYVRLAQRAAHPVLSELVRRIARQEGRHIDFYAAEARGGWLTAGPPAASCGGPSPTCGGRWARGHASGGDGLRHQAPLRRCRRGAAPERIDRRIDALPGLQGLRLITGAVGLRTATVPTSPAAASMEAAAA